MISHKNSFLLTFLLLAFSSVAQLPADKMISVLSAHPEFKQMPPNFTVAVLPVNNCFTCAGYLMSELQKARSHSVLFVFPSTRAVVQKKIIKEHLAMKIAASYIFDDATYNQLADKSQPKGYIKKMRK